MRFPSDARLEDRADMTWTSSRNHIDKQLDRHELELFRTIVPQRLEQFRNGSAAAVDQLAFSLAWMLIARGPAFVRRELEPIKHLLPQSVAAYVKGCVGNHTLSSMIFEYSDATNIFEIVGLDISPEVLDTFRPFILRIETDRHDMTPDHWTKALLSLALNERQGWAPIAGFAPTQDVPFVPGATFEFNVQGLIAHLGGALLSRAALDDVLPAWHQFMGIAVTLMDARQIDEQVILWVARVVFHHIGKEPLGSVGDRVFEEINRLIVSGA
jgi:hypothetical protein